MECEKQLVLHVCDSEWYITMGYLLMALEMDIYVTFKKQVHQHKSQAMYCHLLVFF